MVCCLCCRHVHVAEKETVTPTTAAFLEFLHSEPLCRLLSHLTGLDLAENLIRPTDCAEFTGTSITGRAVESSTIQEQDMAVMDAQTVSDKHVQLSVAAASSEEWGQQPGPSVRSHSSGLGSELTESEKGSCNGSSTSICGLQGQSPAAKVRGELLCWRPGDYTLASDQDLSLRECELHLLLHFNCNG